MTDGKKLPLLLFQLNTYFSTDTYDPEEILDAFGTISLFSAA